jgi:hypothetical protein
MHAFLRQMLTAKDIGVVEGALYCCCCCCCFIIRQALTAEEVGVVEVVVQQVQLLALVKQRRLWDELLVRTPEVASET